MNQNVFQACADQLMAQVHIPVELKKVASDELSNTGLTLCFSQQEALPIWWESELSKEQLSRLASLAKHKQVVATEFIPAGLATQMRKLGIQYMDAAGNAFISSGGIHITIIGKPKPKPKGRSSASTTEGKTGKAFQAAGLRVVFELLMNPDLANASMRTLAEASDVSLGSVNAIHKDLIAHRYLKKTSAGIRLMDREKLMHRWAELYPYALRQKLLIGRYTSDREDWWQSIRPTSGIQLGGEVAAYQLSHYLTPKDGLLYVQQASLTELMKTLRLRKIKEGEVGVRTIDVYEAFWKIADSESITAPELVVYSDLLATDEPRCLDAAERIKHEYLR
ncbi:type IV toxin-antitoxin system AbiEi family antitoxin [Oceanobacter mangrovi]|uniref:type IV toxin-antitoxin system AbiEi family antitoxin n=1 Tax=Oceanobacter mangrovi TaxID=2862510 RepID=UPI001C8D47AE|nr:type IV toxin-antitoxin system AbiEi family antitoxin [Oceanobacter mangrovi]